MICPKTEPPWEFLLAASRISLQSYELSRLSHAANLRKEIVALLDQWIEENSSALLARWLLQQRDRPPQPQEAMDTTASPPQTGHGVSHNLFEDRKVTRPGNGGPA